MSTTTRQNEDNNNHQHNIHDDHDELYFGLIIVGTLIVVLAGVAVAAVLACRHRRRQRQFRAAAARQSKEEKRKKIESSLVAKVWSDPNKKNDGKDKDKRSDDLELQRSHSQEDEEEDTDEMIVKGNTSVHFCNTATTNLKEDNDDDDQESRMSLSQHYGPQQGICAICLGMYHDGELVVQSCNRNCHHEFHRECIAKWLTKKDECPCCRHTFLSNDDEIGAL